jgi:hypothetical protein
VSQSLARTTSRLLVKKSPAVAESVLALSPMPQGATAADVAQRVSLGDEKYVTSRAAYDLRKNIDDLFTMALVKRLTIYPFNR